MKEVNTHRIMRGWHIPYYEGYRKQKEVFIRKKPQKDKSEKRDHVIPIRFTEEERRILKEKSELHQLSLSECVRRLALNRRFPAQALPKINLETYKELCQIGNNLNQLVRHFHAGKIPLVDQHFFESLREKVKKVGLEVMGV